MNCSAGRKQTLVNGGMSWWTVACNSGGRDWPDRNSARSGYDRRPAGAV